MPTMRISARSLRRAVSALLMLVLALAPFEARVMMAAHAGSHDHPGSAAAPEMSKAAGHHHQMTHDHHGSTGHEVVDGVSKGNSAPATEHHDHSGGPDGACCGAFCHSACIEVAVLDIPNPMPTAVFERLVSAPLIAVVQGQLQRPPSPLLSI
jgi:hypothetical protein